MPRGVRQETVATERRRRQASTLDRIHGQRLALPDRYANDRAYHYHWINDEKGKIQYLTTQDDYDVCPGDDCRIPVGQSDTGQPLYAVLLRKKMEYYLADQREKLGEIAKGEQAMAARKAIEDPTNPDAEKHSYAVSGNSIKSGPFVP